MTTACVNVLPSTSTKRSALKVEKSSIKWKQHRTREGELLTPIRHWVGAQDQWILNLLNQLVSDFLWCEEVNDRVHAQCSIILNLVFNHVLLHSSIECFCVDFGRLCTDYVKLSQKLQDLIHGTMGCCQERKLWKTRKCLGGDRGWPIFIHHVICFIHWFI